MTLQDIANLRLLNQQIAIGKFNTPLEVVKHMGAMQAQDYYGSLWAIGLRCNHTEKEVIKAIEDLKIVRTWPQRGTLHFVPAEDAKWLVSLSADRLLKGAQRRRQNLGLDDTVLLKSTKVVTMALQHGMLTRQKVMDALEATGISTQSGRGYHILWYLSQSGVTFIGPMQGKQQTIGLLDKEIACQNYFDPQDGKIELAKRFFISHGPATVQDFVRWSGLTTVDVKVCIEANKPLLVSQKVDDQEYWMPKELPDQTLPITDSYLLSGFDEYMLGYKDRTASLHINHAQKIVPGGNGMFLPTIVVNGQVVGTWKRAIKKNHVLISLSPFEALTNSELESLKKPANQYGQFLSLPTKLKLDSKIIL